MRITTTTLASAALMFSVGCMTDGLTLTGNPNGTTTRQIQSCYNTGGGYVCVDTPNGVSVQDRDVNGDLIMDTFMCADEDSDSDSNSMSTSDSDLDSDSSESTSGEDSSSSNSESDSDDSDSDSACDGPEGDGDGDGVVNGLDCDCGDGGGGDDPGDGGGGDDGGGIDPVP